METLIDGVLLTPLKIIDTPGGNVFHGMNMNDPGYMGFGEAYFSAIEAGAIKAWKRHREMTLNLMVPVGKVRFVIFDDRPQSSTCNQFQQITLSPEYYFRMTVPPMLWMGFQGESSGMVLNVANMRHVPDEVDRKPVESFSFEWG